MFLSGNKCLNIHCKMLRYFDAVIEWRLRLNYEKTKAKILSTIGRDCFIHTGVLQDLATKC